jgi:valacyclovir hydrolase
VIAPDPRGYGRSRPPDRDFSEDFFTQDARDMASLMEGLGHRTFHVAGWSDGGNSAVLLAAAFPEKVLKLVVWGGNSYFTQEDVDQIEGTRSISGWSSRMRTSLESVYGSSLQSIWSGYCDGIQRRFQTAPDVCRKELELIRCPTLILHGEQDPIIAPQHPRVFHDGIKGSQLHVIPDGRHNIHLARADEFNRVVLAFFNQ